MSILSNLHPKLALFPFASQNKIFSPPVAVDDLKDLTDQFPNTPTEFIDILETHDGVIIGGEGALKSIEIVIFSATDALLTMTEWYPWLTEDMPDCFFFGRDGDDVYLYGMNNNKYGIYKVGFAGPDWEWAEYIGNSLASILIDGEGWDH